MSTARKTALALAFSSAFIALLAACGDDENGGTPTPPTTNDGGTPDAAPPPGPCQFNDFVLGLINTSTNGTALPSEDLGDNCTDTQTPFPEATFQ